MAKLRIKKKGIPGKTVNHEGGEAFKPTNAKHELVLATLTCFYREPQFYEGGDTVAQRIADLVSEVETSFVLQLAMFARNVMHLRSTPIFLLILATAKRDYPVKDYVEHICVRADDLLEYMGGYVDIVGRPIPSAMKRGINDALKRFTEYHIAKYAGGSRTWTWKGLVKMTHPSQPDALIKKIMEKDGAHLETPYTWETELSAKGNKKEVWHGLIDSKQLPYMAMLRNLRNMTKAGIDRDHLTKVVENLKNPEAVRKSRQLPFRFLSAYRAIEQGWGDDFDVTLLRDALSDAIDISANNMKVLPGRTEVVIDVSGSMDHRISDRSEITMKDAGAILGAVATHVMPESVIAVFADNVGIMSRMRAGSSILDETERILSQNMGGSTHGYKVMAEARANKRFVDRFVIFTDCELYTETNEYQRIYSPFFGHGNTFYQATPADTSFRKAWLKYKAEVNPKVKLYIINLASNALMPVSSVDKDVVVLSGFSERVMDVISMTEAGIDEQVRMIENYVLPTGMRPTVHRGDSEDAEGVHSGDD